MGLYRSEVEKIKETIIGPFIRLEIYSGHGEFIRLSINQIVYYDKHEKGSRIIMSDDSAVYVKRTPEELDGFFGGSI